MSTPQTAVRQMHRANAPADSPEAYYRRNIMMPFLDHITNEMQARFGPIHQTKVKLLGLVPTIAPTYSLASIKDVSELYKADLPSPQLLSTEFNRWKIRCTSLPLDKRPNTLQEALQYCDKDAFPNIYVCTTSHSMHLTCHYSGTSLNGLPFKRKPLYSTLFW